MTSGHPSINAGADEWLVFADQLQQKGDPRGELIVLNHSLGSGGSVEARDQFVKANADRLLGPLAKYADAVRIGWRWMWFDTVELTARSTDDAGAVAALLETPASSQMTALTLGGDPSSESERIELMDAIGVLSGRGLPAGCRSLSLIDARAARSHSVIATFYDPPANMVDFGDLAALWPKLANVKQLRFSVSDGMQLQLGAIDAPSLESFKVDCLTWGGQAEIPEALDEANWPNLQSLELRLPESWTFSTPDDPTGYTRPYADRDEDDEYYGDDDGYHEDHDWGRRLRPLLASLRKTKLKRLALTSFNSPSNVLEAIADAGLPDTVQELDFSDSTFGGDAATTLAANAELMRKLKRLVLERTPVSAEELAPLRGAGLEVVHSEGSGATYRFLVGME